MGIKEMLPWNLIPKSIKVYSNEEEGIFAFEIDQPPSIFAPAKVSYYEDRKKGIMKYHGTNEESLPKKSNFLQIK